MLLRVYFTVILAPDRKALLWSLGVCVVCVKALVAEESGFTIHHASTWPGYLTGVAQGISSYQEVLYVQVDVSGGGWDELRGRPGADKVLAVFDIHEPAKPVRVSTVEGVDLGLPYFFGNYAVAVGGAIGLNIYDCSNPTNPLRVHGGGNSIVPVGVSGFVTSGSIGYATTHYGPLFVLDLSDVRAPRVLKTISAGFQQHLGFLAIASSRTLCISAGNDRWGSGAGILLMDISSPTAPVQVGAYSAGGEYGRIVAWGSRIIGRTSTGGLDIINVANPASPSYLGTYSKSWVGDFQIADNRLYASVGGTDVLALNFAQPSELVEVGRYTNGTMVHAFSKLGDFIYTTASRGPMKVIEISGPTNAAIPSVFEPPAPVMLKVAVVSGRAYVPQFTDGLRIFDVTHPSNPKLLSESLECQRAVGCAVTNGFAYVADSIHGLVILDVRDPSNIVRVGSIANLGQGSANDVVVSGHYAYVRNAGIDIIDISDPAHPTRTAHWPDGSYSTIYSSLAIAGNHAYFPSEPGLAIVDISNPFNPQLRATFVTNFWSPPKCVSIAGNKAYLAAGELWVLDIGDPSHPRALARFQDEYRTVNQFSVSGRYGFATQYGGSACEFTAMDIRDPINLHIVARFTGLADGLSLALEGHYAWICNRDGGLTALALNPSGPPLPATLGANLSGSGMWIEVRGQPMRTHILQTSAFVDRTNEWQNLATNWAGDGIFSIAIPAGQTERAYFRVFSN